MGVGASVYMCHVGLCCRLAKVHVHYLISCWVLVYFRCSVHQHNLCGSTYCLSTLIQVVSVYVLVLLSNSVKH